MAAPTTLQESLQDLKSRVTPEQAAELDTVVQFDIGGDSGGTWNATIKHGELHLNEGPTQSPNLILQTSSSDWLDMVAGRKTSQMLFMTGKLKIKGDITLALRLASLLRI